MKRTLLAALATALLVTGCESNPTVGGIMSSLSSGLTIGSGSGSMPSDSGFQPLKTLKALTTTDISPEQELQIGREAAAVLLGAAPLVKNEAVQRYVGNVGQWVAAQAARPDIAWHFGVIDTPHVNAFAAPGGFILITRGLLERLEGESELAAVLAHEIAHVLQRHYVKGMISKDRTGAIIGLLGEAAASSRGHRYEIGALTNVAKGLYSSGLDKDDEYQADRIGVVLSVRAGYDPYGLARVLQMYAASSGDESFELLFGTHPSPQSRLEALARMIDGRFDAFERSGAQNTAAFDRAVGHLKRDGRG